jgi:hypothetical protein
METKNIIIGSLALAVIGGGAYLFIKNKRVKDASKLAELQQATKLASEVKTGGTTTPDKVLASAPVTNAQAQANQQELINLTQASSLINQIISLRNTKKSMPVFNFGNMSDFASLNSSVTLFNIGVENKIANIKAQMKLLGYEEKNGLAVKL